ERGRFRRRERAVAIAQEHVGEAIVAVVITAPRRHREVELAVAVEVAHGYGPGLRTEGDFGWGLEGAVAVAEQYAHVAVAAAQVGVVGRHEVELAAFVEVAHRQGSRT